MSALAKASDPKGLKRVCASCGIRFYDLNKRPICCPNCSTEFTGEIKVKGRRARAVPDEVIEKKGKATTISADDEDEIAPDAETVSLEEIEEDGADDEEDTAEADLELDVAEIEELDDDLDDLEEEIEVVADEDEA